MAITSKKNGDHGELIVGRSMHEMGYWVHLTQRNRSGAQPVDIIAAKHADQDVLGPISKDVVWLLDAKYVEKGDRFYFSDIQPNQIESMRMARDFAKLSNIGFAIIFAEFSERIVYFLPFNAYENMAKYGSKSVHRIDIGSLEEWESTSLCLR